ncbi:hypothetical protein KPH14_008764 [Odynerus spinipes]|uniref:COX assembly mitochondrial protein n=1 Tax=Odynerus spinipes TaxID=1348599 RepID=A0AAD9R896_9HYME|nr:hypothetical protein KPH14_008764 [Odynerus spinipes]
METKTDVAKAIPPKYGAGPHGIGDPDDKTLRKVELNVLIPQIIRDRTREEKCIPEVKEFTECCKENKFLMVFNCRAQNNKLQKCSERWYNDKEFQEECKQIYLQRRSEYRRTNIPQKYKKTESK